MLYVGKGVTVVPQAGTVTLRGGWLLCTADATVNVVFSDGSTITAMPMKAGQQLAIDILSAANASVANAIYVVRPRG